MIDTTIRTSFQTSKALTLVTDNEGCRYALGCLQVTPSEKDGQVYVAATDGRIAAVIEADGETDQQRLVPQEVLPTRKGNCEITLNGQWYSDQGKYSEDRNFGRFPHIADCIPNVSEEDTITLRVNADFLLRLANAVGPDESGAVSIHIPVSGGNSKFPSQVTTGVAVSGCEGAGIIMPCPDNNRTKEIATYNQRVEEFAKADREARKSS